MTDYTPSKQCTKCGRWKPATARYFGKGHKGSGRLSARCKECDAAYRRANLDRDRAAQKAWRNENKEHLEQHQQAYREENREQILTQRREHYEENKERILAQQREHRARNPEMYSEQDRERRLRRGEYLANYLKDYYIKNREKLIKRFRINYLNDREGRREYNRKRYIANKDVFAAYSRNRKARKRNAPGSHTPPDIRRQYKAQKGKCYYCGVEVGDRYHVDHVIPLSRGGSNGPENLVIACPECNLSKRAKLPHEWPQGGRLL